MEEDRDQKRRNHTKARWCVDTARYTATALLVLLVLVVILGAIAASLRSQQLDIYIARGYVSVAGLSPASNSSLPPPGNVSLSLVLVLSNPSGRADVSYNKSCLVVADNNDKVIYSSPHDIVVQVGRKEVLELSMTVALDEHSPMLLMATLVQMMNGTKTAKVSLSGVLETQFTGLNFIPPRPHLANYNCSQVTIGRLPQREVRAAGAADVYCQDLSATKWQ